MALFDLVKFEQAEFFEASKELKARMKSERRTFVGSMKWRV